MEKKSIYLTKRRLGENLFPYIAQLVNILTACDYDVLIKQEESDIYSLSYARSACINGEDWGDDRFMLVSAEEEDMIYSERSHNEDSEDADENNLFADENEDEKF